MNAYHVKILTDKKKLKISVSLKKDLTKNRVNILNEFSSDRIKFILKIKITFSERLIYFSHAIWNTLTTIYCYMVPDDCQWTCAKH